MVDALGIKTAGAADNTVHLARKESKGKRGVVRSETLWHPSAGVSLRNQSSRAIFPSSPSFLYPLLFIKGVRAEEEEEEEDDVGSARPYSQPFLLILSYLPPTSPASHNVALADEQLRQIRAVL